MGLLVYSFHEIQGNTYPFCDDIRDTSPSHSLHEPQRPPVREMGSSIQSKSAQSCCRDGEKLSDPTLQSGTEILRTNRHQPHGYVVGQITTTLRRAEEWSHSPGEEVNHCAPFQIQVPGTGGSRMHQLPSESYRKHHSCQPTA